MAQEDNYFGIESLEFGTPGDGIMGAVLTAYSDIEVGSVSIEGESSTENTIPTEANDAYVTLNADVTPMSFTARLYGVSVDDYPLFMGGATATSKWSAPKVKPNIYLSVRLTTQALSGFKRVVEIPYGKVNARIQGTITKDGLPAIDIVVTANTPISSGQVEGAPYTVEEVAA